MLRRFIFIGVSACCFFASAGGATAAARKGAGTEQAADDSVRVAAGSGTGRAATASWRVGAAAPSAMTRPLGEVLREVGARFGVRVACKRFDADTCLVTHAPYRVRPYALEETLDNLLHPLDLVWSRRDEGRIVVQPYEFYRRTPAEGERLLRWLAAQYADREAWEARRERVLAGVREALCLEPFAAALVPRPDVRMGPLVRHTGYTTQNYALETLPGLYVCGTVYAPAAPGRHPLVVSPAGHWEGGRYRPDQQLRMATLARMGAVTVDMDIFGWGDSELQVGREAHTMPCAMQVQVLWSKAVTDWIVAARRDIDTTRMAATGGSGGATHALMLACVDGRMAALAPVVHLVAHFDGGCPCENGRPVTLAARGTCMPEILAAAMAPRLVLVVSDGGDWTASYPASEYPYLKHVWGLCGAADAVRNVHLPDEGHDYGPRKRRAVYAFFAQTLGLDMAAADESGIDIQPAEALRSFAEALPEGAVRSREELERIVPKPEP